VDQFLFHLINERWTHPALDLFMAAVSDIEIWKPLLIVLALCVLIFGGFKGRAFVVCLALALVLADYLLVTPQDSNRSPPAKQVQKLRMVRIRGPIRDSSPSSSRRRFATRMKPIATIPDHHSPPGM
jgi:predicted membrane protein